MQASRSPGIAAIRTASRPELGGSNGPDVAGVKQRNRSRLVPTHVNAPCRRRCHKAAECVFLRLLFDAMARFHFNIFDGRNSTDVDGTEFPSWKEARLEAIRLAGKVIADEAESIAPEEGWYMEMTDARGLVLFRLDLTAVTGAGLDRAA